MKENAEEEEKFRSLQQQLGEMKAEMARSLKDQSAFR
jgi:hypothetical protein